MFDKGAWSFAPMGLCPIGRFSGAIFPGLGICTSWPGSGCACAAAPEQPSAFSCGAVSPAHRTGMIAHANHYEALPLLGDTTNPPVHTRQRRLSDVTLGAGGLHVIYGTKGNPFVIVSRSSTRDLNRPRNHRLDIGPPSRRFCPRGSLGSWRYPITTFIWGGHRG